MDIDDLHIKAVYLEPSDILVVQSTAPLSHDQMEEFNRQASQVFNVGCRVVCIGSNVTLTTLRELCEDE